MNKLTFHISYDLESFKRDFAEYVEGVELEDVWDALMKEYKGHLHIEDVNSLVEQIVETIQKVDITCDDHQPPAQEQSQ